MLLSFKLIWTIIGEGSFISVVSLSEWPAAGLCSGPDEASASSADWEEPQWPHWPGELLYFVIMSDCLTEQTHIQCRLCALQTCLKNAQTSLPWKVWLHYMFTGGFEFPCDTFVSCILDHDWLPNYFWCYKIIPTYINCELRWAQRNPCFVFSCSITNKICQL